MTRRRGSFKRFMRVNLEGRANDSEPLGQRAERALDLLERGLGDYAKSPTRGASKRR